MEARYTAYQELDGHTELGCVSTLSSIIKFKYIVVLAMETKAIFSFSIKLNLILSHEFN